MNNLKINIGLIMACISVVLYVITVMGYKFYPKDKRATEELRKYAKFKCFIYFIVIILTAFYEFSLTEGVPVLVILETLLVIFDMIETYSDIKIDQYDEKTDEIIANAREKGRHTHLLRWKHLQDFLNVQMSSFCNHLESDYYTQPAYEIMYDYLKYYPSARGLLEKLHTIAYEDFRAFTKEQLYDAYDACMNDIQYDENNIVKSPIDE